VTDAPATVEVAEREPQPEALQPEPERAQVTPLFCASLATDAENVCVWLTSREALVGETLTEMAGGGLPELSGTEWETEAQAMAKRVPEQTARKIRGLLGFRIHTTRTTSSKSSRGLWLGARPG
jgi:hypothetical protein